MHQAKQGVPNVTAMHPAERLASWEGSLPLWIGYKQGAEDEGELGGLPYLSVSFKEIITSFILLKELYLQNASCSVLDFK
jgi:hypothetical protein